MKRIKPENAVSLESSGAEVDETPPSETLTDAVTSETGTSGIASSASSLPSAATTPAPSATEPAGVRELRERMEAKAASEPERPPHPYKWRIEAPAMIPFGFRDPATGDPSSERIEAHIAECWRADTAPSIAGVLVTQPKA